MKNLRTLLSAVWEQDTIVTHGLIMGRRVEPAGSRRFEIALDVQFEHLGQQRQAVVRPRAFTEAAEARRTLGHWPIGATCRLRFKSDRPDAVALVGLG